MATTKQINVHELLQIADAVSREKGLIKDIIMEALQDAIARSAKQKFGLEHDIRATIRSKEKDIIVERYRQVVEEINPEEEFIDHFITQKDASNLGHELEIGTYLIDELPSVDIGRISAQSARQIIVQKIRQAERESQYEAYKDRVGEVIHCTVKRVEFGNVMVSLGDYGEGLIKRDHLISKENFKVGDRIRCYIQDVRQEVSGYQVLLSRTSPEFMARLFVSEVPEIYEGAIEIKSVSRDPGSRAKIAVYTEETSIDPVGSCVGLRGGRVQAVSNELQGEKIDIIEWSPDAATFIMNAMSPTPVLRVIVDDESNKVEVVIPDDYLSQAIGRRGQNVRLISQLLGWDIDITTETDDAEKRHKDFEDKTNLFIDQLDVDSILAQFLVSEGFSAVEDIAYIDVEEFQSIEGLDSNIAVELRDRALKAMEEIKHKTLDELRISKPLRNMQGLTIDMLIDLGHNNIKSLDDFASLSADEIIDLSPEKEDDDTLLESPQETNPFLKEYDLTEDQVNKMILAARKALGWIE